MNNKAEWKLKDLSIRFQEYGDYKGKYIGKVEFTNKESEAFTFNVTPQRAEQFLNLIKDQLVDSASHLGEMLLQSLDLLLPAPKPEIGTAIEHEVVN
jgi:hypothetical protein